jgi:AcrR family transcriptional regulator
MNRRSGSKVLLADIMRVLPKRGLGITRRTVRESQRWRMLEAITEAVARRGYAEASVADVIEIAGVSRKTFYEHFRDKEDCFLKAYEVLSARLVVSMKSAIRPNMSVAARRRAQLTKFIDALVSDPFVARAFMVDVLGAGERALRARESVNASFAEAVLGSGIAPIRRAAIVGGVNAVVVGALLEDRTSALPKAVDDLCAFITSALRA